MTLVEIEKLTKSYAEGREALSDLVKMLEDEIAQVKARYMQRIKRTVAGVAERQARLKEAITDSPELFVKPRTITLYGIRIGFMKGRGKVEWEDSGLLVRMIEKNFPEQADVLIKTLKVPVKKALEQLSAAELKKLGITVEETGDQVLIKSLDSEIDKLVNALLKDDVEDEKEAA